MKTIGEMIRDVVNYTEASKAEAESGIEGGVDFQDLVQQRVSEATAAYNQRIGNATDSTSES